MNQKRSKSFKTMLKQNHQEINKKYKGSIMYVIKVKNKDEYLCLSAFEERSSMYSDIELAHESFFASSKEIEEKNLHVLILSKEKAEKALISIKEKHSFYVQSSGVREFGIIDGVHCHCNKEVETVKINL